ncbi:MAG: T9SS type A sorting domain-containing protein [Lewinellaceae bacterium]|nr:T9SS type A sorting domain-containing protein [Saprospiraceae bacterium]MCB9331293.1 T9SS type A sorting domain-containing protein [Lewinellaceae bacterium]
MKMQKFQLLILVIAVCFTPELPAQGFVRLYDATPLVTTNGIIATAQTPDGGYLFFIGRPDRLIKTDPNGDIIWEKSVTVPSSDDPVSDLFVLPNGNYALGVYIENSSSPTAILLFDPQGNQIAQRNYSGFLRFHPVDDGFYAANRLNDSTLQVYRLDAGLNTVWSKPLHTEKLVFLSDLITTNDGGFCMLVSSQAPPFPNGSPKLIKADANGDKSWEMGYQSQNLVFFGSLNQLPSGDYVHLTQDAINSQLCRTDSNGNLLWTKIYNEVLWSSCLTTDGNIALCGSDLGPYKVVVKKVDLDGNTLFSKIYQPNGYTGEAFQVRATPDGGLLIGGYVEEPNQNRHGLLLKTDAVGNIYPNFIQGNAWFDKNHNCAYNATDQALNNWLVTATGDIFETAILTDTSGFYQFNLPPGDYLVQVHRPGDLWTACTESYNLQIGSQPDTLVQDFFVKDSALCSLLDVSIATPVLRRCFDNIYVVSWCNQGTVAAYDVFVQVVLPPQLDFVSATLMPAQQTGDTLWFDLGTVGFAECGSFNLTVNANCDSTIIGQTLCVEARISPDTLCIFPANWSGARVRASGHCVGDTLVEFVLKNIGPAPSDALEYIITEDHVVLYNGGFNLDPGQEMLIQRPANGSTQRIQAEQEPGYPYPSVPSAVVEGCGGFNTLGLVNQFAMDDADPFTDIDCREVIGSWDPNDKQGFPTGYESEHWIEPETELSYLIRFQNTGTDTAFYVEVRDTLSAWLDPATLRVGAASHPFTWTMRDAGALSFRFDNILLPDSNVNEAASHGFVQFKIRPRTDAPLGTVLLNTASIYFDFNAPVVTNTTMHRLGRDFYQVSLTKLPGDESLNISVQPNPFRERTRLVLPDAAAGEYRLLLFDSQGRLLRDQSFQGSSVELNLPDLDRGMYWFELRGGDGKLRARGKMVKVNK